MLGVRSAVATVQALALALALVATCPCDAVASGATADSHACCSGSTVSLRAADAGCCGHCGTAEITISAEVPAGAAKVVAAAFVAFVAPVPTQPKSTADLRAQSVTDTLPSPFAAPTPLRI